MPCIHQNKYRWVILRDFYFTTLDAFVCLYYPKIFPTFNLNDASCWQDSVAIFRIITGEIQTFFVPLLSDCEVFFFTFIIYHIFSSIQNHFITSYLSLQGLLSLLREERTLFIKLQVILSSGTSGKVSCLQILLFSG